MITIDQVITLVGVGVMLVVTVVILLVSRQPTAVRLGGVEHKVANLEQKVDILGAKVGEVSGQMQGFRDVLAKVERQQDMMLQSQLEQERQRRARS